MLECKCYLIKTMFVESSVDHLELAVQVPSDQTASSTGVSLCIYSVSEEQFHTIL